MEENSKELKRMKTHLQSNKVRQQILKQFNIQKVILGALLLVLLVQFKRLLVGVPVIGPTYKKTNFVHYCNQINRE